MLTRYLVPISVLTILAGCHIPTHQRRAAFIEAEYVPYEGVGTASIAGQAFMKTRGGDVKYGAGNQVTLNPVTAYSTEWFQYGVIGGKPLSASDPRAAKYTRQVTADGEGRFVFTDLPAGDYYIACWISWHVSDYQTSGGSVRAKVTVKEGESKTNVILGY